MPISSRSSKSCLGYSATRKANVHRRVSSAFGRTGTEASNFATIPDLQYCSRSALRGNDLCVANERTSTWNGLQLDVRSAEDDKTWGFKATSAFVAPMFGRALNLFNYLTTLWQTLLYRTRSRLCSSKQASKKAQISQPNNRWKALDEIYQIYVPLHLSDLKNRNLFPL